MMRWSSRKMTPIQSISIGFAMIILLGACLLMLPQASKDGKSLSFLNALFTSTSAVCVTGLVVVDTWTQFTLLGQIVLLLLIQIGGLGFMTAVMAVSLLLHKRIGLKQRSILAQSVGIEYLSGIVRLSKQILTGTLLFEGVGSAILMTQFIPVFGVKKGVWNAIFHAVSAFCNAGFDLMGELEPGASLMPFYDSPVVLLTISCLITIGGIGFIVWHDLLEFRREKRSLHLHTKLVLVVTVLLIFAGMVGFFVIEGNDVLANLPLGQKWMNAFFMSVTPRTAGFATFAYGQFTDEGRLLTIILMMIGAAPGGTGGGIKVTTFAVLVLSILSLDEEGAVTSVWKYRLEDKTVRKCYRTTAVYLCLILMGVFVLCFQQTDFAAAVFECFSAIGTVGLSTGITGDLKTASKLVLIILMYIGRLGSMTVFLAINRQSKANKLKNPIGKIIVG